MSRKFGASTLATLEPTKEEPQCVDRVMSDTMETGEARANARRAVLIMRRQLESSRESDISSRSVRATALSNNHNELRQNVDGPADQTSQHNQGVFKELTSDIAHLTKPLYDPADSIEEAMKYSAANAPRSWTRNALPSAKQIPMASTLMQPLKILYDAPDAVETMAKDAMTSPAKYWRPKKMTAPQLLQAGKSAVTEGPVKILYDAADAATEAVGFNSSSSPKYWTPFDSRRTDRAMKQQGLPSGTGEMPPAKNAVPSSAQPLMQDRQSPPGGHSAIPATSNRRGDEQTTTGAFRDDRGTGPAVPGSPQSSGVFQSQRTSHDEMLPSWSTQPGPVSPVQIFIQQPQSQYADFSPRRQQPPSLSTQYRRSRRSRHVPPVVEAQAGDINSGVDDNDTVVRSRHRSGRSRSYRGDESFTSLQVATQSLDRALINLNGLLDEAMSMIDKATTSGRHGEVINIINATNDSFRSAKVSRPEKAHLHRRLLTKLQGSSFSTSLTGSVTTSSQSDTSIRYRDQHPQVPAMALQVSPSKDTMIVHPSGTPLRMSAILSIASGDSAVSPRSHPAMEQERLQSPHLRDGQHDDGIRDPGQRMSDMTGFIIENVDLNHPPRPHLSVSNGSVLDPGFPHKQRPMARNWDVPRKRVTAIIACCNTFSVGLIAGIYAGEVPGIQYQIADIDHRVVLGNVLYVRRASIVELTNSHSLYLGIAVTTMLFWPLPLLHGRKPYTVAAFAIMLPLQYPQALAVQSFHDPDSTIARVGLLLPRAITGLAMGFANINFLPTLLDLYGASLMSEVPHQEHIQLDDVRRQGGGIGLWLGIWIWCYIGSLSIGFCIGACVIYALTPDWGFYLTIILLAVFLFINIIAPETRQAPYRRSVIHIFDHEYMLKRRVASGEVHLHLYQTGPRWWFEEVWAGIVLSFRMIFQAGFFVMNLYFAWIFAQVVLVIILLGALLSRYYIWSSDLVGLASLSLALGALFAVPLTHGGFCSRSRTRPQRTDSMTLRQGGIKWTSHMIRRCTFTLVLPLAGLAYTLASPGPDMSWIVPVVFVGLVGFLSNLAMTECIGLMMETFDTCDLQAGVNNRHRENSLPDNLQKVRTHYSAFPRVCAGFFASQSLGFLLAAAATGVSGIVTRAIGAQISTACVAGILLVLTVLLLLSLMRWHTVQVVPEGHMPTAKDPSLWTRTEKQGADWRPVVLGNSSSNKRRMNLLETGKMSRWSEIRRLNGLEK